MFAVRGSLVEARFAFIHKRVDNRLQSTCPKQSGVPRFSPIPPRTYHAMPKVIRLARTAPGPDEKLQCTSYQHFLAAFNESLAAVRQ